MTTQTTITQTLALVCNTYIAFSKKPLNIYIATLLFNIFALLTGLFQKDYGLVCSYVIIVYRSFGMLLKDKYKDKMFWFPYTFEVAHVLFGIFTWQNMWSLIPMLTPIFTGLILWYYDDVTLYRKNNIINNTLWLVHNVQSQSYIIALTRIYTILVNGLSLIKDREANKNG